MGQRMYCDVCGADTTDKRSSALDGIREADWEGNGEVTDHFDVCVRCYNKWKRFIASLQSERRRPNGDG
jgi:hypothetical protein